MKVVQLDINRGPINQLRSHRMLPEDLVMGHPNITAEQAINENASIQVVMSSICMVV